MSPDYYILDDKANAVMASLESQMRHVSESFIHAALELPPETMHEICEISAEGVQNFENASRGCAPVQRVIIGLAYTLNALKEWREKGPLHGAGDEPANKD